jgi:hypothetical protein
MEILRFYKEWKKNNKSYTWYADIPNWTGRKSALRMVAGADDLLDMVAKGRDEVYLHFSKEYLPDAEVMYFKKKTWVNGATYRLMKFEGRNVKQNVWLCNVTLHVLGEFPRRIYFKEVNDYNEE